MIKLFVSDLDGTLLAHDHEKGSYLPDYNLKAIHKLHDAGVKFAIASGRHQVFLEQLLKEIGFDCDVIGENGAMVVIEGLQHVQTINREHCRIMVEDFYHQPDTCNLNMMAMLVDGSNVVNKNHTNYHHDVNRTRHGKVTNNLETYFDNPQANDCVKLATTVPEGADAEEFTTLMRDRYANYFDIYSSGFRTIEFMTPGIDKGYGLRMVMAHYYLNDDEVAVIGDAANDISMMIYSGHAFGMASGEPHIRKYCRYTAKSVAQAVDEVLAYNQQQQAK